MEKLIMKLFSRTYCYHYSVSFTPLLRTYYYDGTITTDKITEVTYALIRTQLEERCAVGNLADYRMRIHSLTLL